MSSLKLTGISAGRFNLQTKQQGIGTRQHHRAASTFYIDENREVDLKHPVSAFLYLEQLQHLL